MRGLKIGQGIMKKYFLFVITFTVLTSLLSACGGGSQDQVSGIFAEAQYNTAACESKSKMITLRNDDTSQPQRVQAVSFELGTNNNNNFNRNSNISNNGNGNGNGSKAVEPAREEVLGD
jgi:hypothetical protein